MAKLSAMPMFWTDFFADTEHLPEEAAKAYLFLLGHAWIRKACLPNDDRALARLARLSFKKWLAIRGDVMAFFEVNEDGHLHNPRLTKEWKWVSQRVTHNRENGSLGGQKNAAKKLNENNETPVATATDSLKQPTPTPTPTPIREENTLSVEATDGAGAGKPAKGRKPYPEGFETFWKACHPWVGGSGKGEAYDVWKRLSVEDRDLAMNGVPGYTAALAKPDAAKPLHVCRYLSKRRYESHQPNTNVLAFERREMSHDEMLARAKAADEAERREAQLKDANP